MFISIVIPTYNRVNSLKETIKSLIEQDIKEQYEIIVCDDGSIDGTTEYMNGLIEKGQYKNIRYYKQKNSGPASARNLGIRNAYGDIVGFIDDDCVASRCWIQSAAKYFGDKDIAGVQGPTVPLGTIQYKKKFLNYVRTSDVTEQNFAYATCNIFYKKEILYNVGFFDEKIPKPCWGEDTDLGNRVILQGYKIIFDHDVKVFHEIQYIRLDKYLKSLKKYEGRAYLVKRYPSMREQYLFKFIDMRGHVYPIFLFATLVLIAIGSITYINIQYIYILAIITALFYLWARVLIDKNYKSYIRRILHMPRYLLIDIYGLYYTIKGCIKYKTIVI